MMRKKILLPTDFSANSWNAIKYASKLFGNDSCDFYILNTFTVDAFAINNLSVLKSADSINEGPINNTTQGLGNILTRLTALRNEKDHKYHVSSTMGNLLDKVKCAVKDLDVDYIIMGAKGETDDNECKCGKNTKNVVENIRNCPVLVVPKNVTYDLPKEIVLAVDFNANINILEIKNLVELARTSNASVQILSLSGHSGLSLNQKKNKVLIKNLLKDVQHSFNVLHNVEMSAALSCFLEMRTNNMISYIDKRRTLWESLGFAKQSLSKVGYFDDVPVLALHG